MNDLLTRAGLLALVVAVVGAVLPGTAHAQGGRREGPGLRAGGMGFGEGQFTPGVDGRELERYQQILKLTPDQRETVRSLFEGYNEEFRAAAASARKKMEAAREEARENQDRNAFRGMRDMMQEFRDTRDAMEKAFFADVQAVLTPEQQAAWPAVERVRRRERTVQRGLMSGERVDVVRLTEQQELAPETRAAVAPVLEQYEAELDRALIERNRLYDEGMTQMGELFAAGDNEEARARARDMMEEARRASVRVREINRKYARQVQAMLPEAAQWEFERAVKHASFPMIYRETRATREIGAAQGFSDLDETQRQGLETLARSYRRDLETVNDELSKATQEMEESITVDRVLRGRRGEMDEGPAGDLWRKRRDMERATSENLRKLLRPEQVERLPQPEREDAGERERRGGRGPDGDDEPRRRRDGGGGGGR